MLSLRQSRGHRRHARIHVVVHFDHLHFDGLAEEDGIQIDRAQTRLQSELSPAMLAQIESFKSLEGVLRIRRQITLGQRGLRGPKTSGQHAAI